MASGFVAGVYIERSRAMFLMARPMRTGQCTKLDFLAYEEAVWDARDPEEAAHGLRILASVLGRSGPDLSHVAIASYGPFQSLTPTASTFSVLQPERADLPFRGVNLARLFREEFVRHGAGRASPAIHIDTDANACALAEVHARNWPREHTLFFLLLTEGIGAAVVNGHAVFPSQLHPEIGLMHVRLHPDDNFFASEEARSYGLSLTRVAANPSRIHRRNVRGDGDEDAFWRLRAYYVGQAALAATVILSPHKIVIAADLEPENGDTLARVREEFVKLMKRRDNAADPFLPLYAEDIREPSALGVGEANAERCAALSTFWTARRNILDSMQGGAVEVLS